VSPLTTHGHEKRGGLQLPSPQYIFSILHITTNNSYFLNYRYS